MDVPTRDPIDGKRNPDINLIQEFRARLSGNLILKGEVDYEAARKLHNAMIDRHPAMIVRCKEPADVVEAIHFARQNDLAVAVRGGGHSASGLGSVEDGLVIDLCGMKKIHVNAEAKTVRVAGGCTWGEVDRATHAFGLATPSGLISTTGVGGLTLGGGTGHLTRKYGLTIDNLLEVEIVLADGRLVKANAGDQTDLFWAVRGGGGNFGVITSFLFRLHPLQNVVAGPMLWSIEQAARVMRYFRSYILSAAEDISGFFAFITVPPNPHFPEYLHFKKMLAIAWCYTGVQEKAEAVFGPIRQFEPPSLDLVGPMPFPALQSMFDPSAPPGIQNYWRADFFNELSDAVIDLHVKHAAQMPTMLSTVHLYPINGAAHRVRNDETAFGFRSANWSQIIAGADPDPANNQKMIAWAKDYWQALHPYSAGGAYVNFLMEESQERVRSAYRENYERLAAVKSKYDPGNFFHVNQNILPASNP